MTEFHVFCWVGKHMPQFMEHAVSTEMVILYVMAQIFVPQNILHKVNKFVNKAIFFYEGQKYKVFS